MPQFRFSHVSDLASYLENRPEPSDSDWSHSQIADFVEAFPGGAVVKHHQGQVVALILFHCTPDEMEVVFLETHPTFRQQGHMKELVQWWVDKYPRKTVWLEASAQNLPAARLYSSLGFQQTSIRPSYYRDGSDALVLQLKPRKS